MPIKEEVIIGDARLIRGDCLEVMQTLDKVDAVETDPPYGIGEAKANHKSRSRLAAAIDYKAVKRVRDFKISSEAELIDQGDGHMVIGN